MSARYFFKEAAGTPVRLPDGNYLYFEVVGNAGGSTQGVVSASGEYAEVVAKIPGVLEIKEDEYLRLTAAGRTRVSTRTVDAMSPVMPQPEIPDAKPAKPELAAGDPRAVVKLGKG